MIIDRKLRSPDQFLIDTPLSSKGLRGIGDPSGGSFEKTRTRLPVCGFEVLQSPTLRQFSVIIFLLWRHTTVSTNPHDIVLNNDLQTTSFPYILSVCFDRPYKVHLY